MKKALLFITLGLGISLTLACNSLLSLPTNATVGPTPTPCSSCPTATPTLRNILHGNQIAFASWRAGCCSSQLFIMNQDGSGVQQLTFDGPSGPLYTYPIISPNNTKILFSSNRTGISQLFTMDTNGVITQLTHNSNGSLYYDEPCWSPDGTQIAVIKATDSYNPYFSGYGQIFTLKADGSNEVNISNNGYQDRCPAWHDHRIAFATNESGSFGSAGIWVMNQDGTNRNQIIPSGYSASPAWSPDGTRIAFCYNVSPCGPSGGLAMTNADGSNAYPMFATSGAVETVRFSSDGSHLIGVLETNSGYDNIISINSSTTPFSTPAQVDFKNLTPAGVTEDFFGDLLDC